MSLFVLITGYTLWADIEIAIVIDAFFALFFLHLVIIVAPLSRRRCMYLNVWLHHGCSRTASASDRSLDHRILLLLVLRLLHAILGHGCLRFG